jgi:hypothetical protein
VCRLLIENPAGERPLGRSICRRMDNIRTDGVVWTGLVWLRIGTALVYATMILRVP